MLKTTTSSIIIATLQSLLFAADPITVSEPYSKGGGLQCKLQNTSSSPVTAYLVQVTLYSGLKRTGVASHYLDIYVNAGFDKPILAGESREVPVVPSEVAARSRVEIVLAGAQFADGTFFGTEKGRAILNGRRNSLGDALATVSGKLSSTGSGGGKAGLTAAIDELEAAQKMIWRTKTSDEITALMTASLPMNWVKETLGKIEGNCLGDCLAGRVRFLNDGLAAWGDRLRVGLDETKRQH